MKWRGYIIAAPSLHVVTKRPYVWNVDYHPDDVQIALAPCWFYEAAAPKKNAAGHTDWGALELEVVGVGDRTDTLTRLCGHLLRKYVDPDVAHALLWAWNQRCCSPPLDRKKFMATLNGIAACEMKRRVG